MVTTRRSLRCEGAAKPDYKMPMQRGYYHVSLFAFSELMMLPMLFLTPAHNAAATHRDMLTSMQQRSRMHACLQQTCIRSIQLCLPTQWTPEADSILQEVHEEIQEQGKVHNMSISVLDACLDRVAGSMSEVHTGRWLHTMVDMP